MSAPRTTRRQTLGYAGLAAAAALVATDAAEAGAAGPDADLLAACAEYHRVETEWAGPWVDDDWSNDLCKQESELLDRIAELKPRTLEGVRAKAAVGAHAVLAVAMDERDTPWRQQVDSRTKITVDLLHHLAGRHHDGLSHESA